MKTKSVLVFLCALALAISGCTPPLHAPTALPNAEVSLNLSAPVAGGVFPIAEYIDLSVFAFAHESTISGLTFLANGSAIGDGVFAPPDYFYGRWLPPDSGEYYVQARVTLADGITAVSEPHRICLMPFGEPPAGDLGPAGLPLAGGYTAPCQLPTRIPPNARTSGDVVVNAVVAPRALQYGARGCFTPEQTVTFIATVDDPQDLVVLVMAKMINAGATAQDVQYLNWITSRTGNQKEYRRTIQPAPYFYGGVIQWYVWAFGRDGRQLGSDQGFINYEIVGCNPLVIGPSATLPVLHLAPSETPTLTPEPLAPPRFTFNKNAFCRRGPDTSFPDVTAIASGDTVDILNVSEDGFWYYVFWKQFDAKCWVAASTGLVNGDVTGIKVLVGPELPKPGLPPAPPPAPGSEPAPVPCNPLIRVCP